MFLGSRSTQAEYFDQPGRSAADTLRALRELDRLNRFFVFSRPFEEIVPRWLGTERCRRLNILDVGAGSGLLSRQLKVWAGKRGWDWRFTNLDLNPYGLQQNNSSPYVVGSCLDLPFPDNHFDLVVASQMTHHLTDDEIVRHLREAWRVTHDALFISDLHRNLGLYLMLMVFTPLLLIGRETRQDSLQSVKRGFRLGELRDLASKASLMNSKVRLYYGTRVVLQARKMQ